MKIQTQAKAEFWHSTNEITSRTFQQVINTVNKTKLDMLGEVHDLFIIESEEIIEGHNDGFGIWW